MHLSWCFLISCTWDSLQFFYLGVYSFHQTGKNSGCYFLRFVGAQLPPLTGTTMIHVPGHLKLLTMLDVVFIFFMFRLLSFLLDHSCGPSSHAPIFLPWCPICTDSHPAVFASDTASHLQFQRGSLVDAPRLPNTLRPFATFLHVQNSVTVTTSMS